MENEKELMVQVNTGLKEGNREKLMRLYWRFQMARLRLWNGVTERANTLDPGIDGILVTVGLCIIALLLCVVMKNSLTEFIQSIVSSMTKEASDILKGTRV